MEASVADDLGEQDEDDVSMIDTDDTDDNDRVEGFGSTAGPAVDIRNLPEHMYAAPPDMESPYGFQMGDTDGTADPDDRRESRIEIDGGEVS